MGRYDFLLGDDQTKQAPPVRVSADEVKPQPVNERPAEKLTERKTENKPVPLAPPVLPVPPVRDEKRVMKQRHPFDIYEDQYQSLRELALQERMQGGVGSMSAMV